MESLARLIATMFYIAIADLIILIVGILLVVFVSPWGWVLVGLASILPILFLLAYLNIGRNFIAQIIGSFVLFIYNFFDKSVLQEHYGLPTLEQLEHLKPIYTVAFGKHLK